MLGLLLHDVFGDENEHHHGRDREPETEEQCQTKCSQALLTKPC
jgi:hypothetical protein